ncbi:PIN domain-containing protein, partial [Opitutales bacterium]|nr:PIN domain-containing protein [Opitutales bacterium]
MILDTNALSALAGRDENLINQLSTSPRICTTLISLGEYTYGLNGCTPARRKLLQAWLDAFLERAEILSPNRQTIESYAAVRAELKAAGTPIPANDCWIAALARQHKLGL